MINGFMKIVYTRVHESLDDKTTDYINKRAKSLGIENKECYHKERLMFLISQHIAHYIDMHVQQSKILLSNNDSAGKLALLKTNCNINSLLKNRNQLLDQSNNRNHTLQFVIAVFLHHYICGPCDIFKSVKLIESLQTEMLSQCEIEQMTLETFKQNERIKQLSNQRQFNCICPYGESQQSARCEKCMRKFHPECQYQKIVCNRCFLSHYFFPIDSTFFSKFGEKRKTTTYFHSKFRCHNPNDQKKSQLFAIKFDIDDFQDMQNANEPQFVIKIINFKSLASNEQRLQKWKSLNSKSSDYSIFINFNRFEFFLNFFQLRRKHLYFRDENSLIFKLENRMPKSKDNILMIKCDPHFFQDETYEIGIYRISKIKGSGLKEKSVDRQSNNENMNNLNDDEDISKSVRITVEQFNLLQRFSKVSKTNKLLESNCVKTEISKIKMDQSDEDYLNQKNQKSTNYQFVRSYGCNHKKGFDLTQLKRSHLSFMESNRETNRNKDFKIQIEKLIEKHLFKQYKKHAMRMNIKTEENLPFKENHLESIRRYCIDNNLLKSLEIPELQNFEKNLVENEIKKYIGRYQIKNLKMKKQNRKQVNEKEYKKYKKFAKCPICQNYLSALYLLPDQYRQGEQIRISNSYRTLKKKKIKLTEEQAQESMLQMFRPKSIFRFRRNKKQEESESQYNEFSDDEMERMNCQEGQQSYVSRVTPKILLSNEDHKQIFENSEVLAHKICTFKMKYEDNKIIEGLNEYKNEQKTQLISLNSERYEKFTLQQMKKDKEIETKSFEVKVLSEESSQNNPNENQQISQQNIITIHDSQSHLQELSFDSPIVNFQEVKFDKHRSIDNLHNEIKPFDEIIKKQFFSIEDLQNEQNCNNFNKKIINIKNPSYIKDRRNMYSKTKQLELKKSVNTNVPPRQIIQISLLSEDSEEQGEMKIF